MFFRRSCCCCCKAKSFEQIIPLLSLLLSLTHELNSHASFKKKIIRLFNSCPLLLPANHPGAPNLFDWNQFELFVIHFIVL